MVQFSCINYHEQFVVIHDQLIHVEIEYQDISSNLVLFQELKDNKKQFIKFKYKPIKKPKQLSETEDLV